MVEQQLYSVGLFQCDCPTVGGFPGHTSGKEPACQCRRHKRQGFNPWVGKIPGGGHGNPLLYCCLENPTEGGASQAAVHGAAKSRTRLSDLASVRYTGHIDEPILIRYH